MTQLDAKIRVMVIGGGCAGLLIAQVLKKVRPVRCQTDLRLMVQAGIPCTVFEQASSIDARPRDWNFAIYWAQSPLEQCLPEDINNLLLTAQVDNHVPNAKDAIPVFHGETGEKIKEIPAPYSLRLGKKKFTRLISRGLDIQGILDSYDKPDIAHWDWMLIQTWIQEEPTTLSGNAIIEDMKRRTQSFADPYKTIIQAIPDGTKAWHNRLSYWPTQPWDNLDGRVTLAGDAAHPMTFHRGQGLNNAIHDAATLLQQLLAMPEKTPEALAAAVLEYEKEVWQRGKAAVESSAQNTLMVHDWAKMADSPLLKFGTVQKVEIQQNKAEAVS
ncbi:hypothetical protein H2199_005855 [Coniosporium tulheliwenetii]|uniref:Uncharacterized protein n=1 Tax=Coniosporium tulheliwenetii TaxID=3383036 RepID=A0ACC2YZ91_9PEZI|nr:hypothetical protein H2199_005855 [Cladosporium sp. JES 115]